MTFAQKYVIVKTTPPFDMLDEGDAAAIADVCFVHKFGAGELVAGGGMLATHLFIAISGGIVSFGGKPVKIFDPSALLSFSEYECDAYADSSKGAECLVMTREHFLSAARNCPSILVRMAEVWRDIK